MYELNFQESESKAVLSFNSPLTIQNIAEIREAFLNAVNKADSLVIIHENVEEYDIAYLQILIAIQKSMHLSGKKLEIKGNKDDAFHSFLETAGCKSISILYDDVDSRQGGSENE